MWYDEVLQYISEHVQQVLLIDWLFGLKGFQCKVKLCTKILVGGVTEWYRNLALTPSFRFLNYQKCFYASKIVNATQYKKLAPNAFRFTYQNLKPWKSHEKKWNKEYQTLSLQFFTNRCILMNFVFVFSCGFQDFKF